MNFNELVLSEKAQEALPEMLPDRFDWDGEPTDEEMDAYVYEVVETEWIDRVMNEIENKANQGWY